MMIPSVRAVHANVLFGGWVQPVQAGLHECGGVAYPFPTFQSLVLAIGEEEV